jgi:hypothetical protein
MVFDNILDRSHNTENVKVLTNYISKNLSGWKIKSTDIIDGEKKQSSYTFKKFTTELRGDRVGKKTIELVQVDNINTNNKSINITFKRNF